MAELALSLPYILQNEGGFTIDSGGPTNFGLTIPDVAAYREVSESEVTEQDMRDIQIPEVTAIYRQQYWDAMGLDNVTDQNIATCIFDTGVNRGIHVGALYAQQVCRRFDCIVDLDGIIGPMTIKALNLMIRGAFIASYEYLVFAGYQSILAAHPQDEIYRAGWEARAKRLLTLAQ